MPVTIPSLLERKRRGERFAMLTAYDYTTARILAEAEIPVLLVGDTLGMVMLGYRTTLPVTMEEMLHHARAVARGAPDQLLVGRHALQLVPRLRRAGRRQRGRLPPGGDARGQARGRAAGWSRWWPG